MTIQPLSPDTPTTAKQIEIKLSPFSVEFSAVEIIAYKGEILSVPIPTDKHIYRNSPLGRKKLEYFLRSTNKCCYETAIFRMWGDAPCIDLHENPDAWQPPTDDSMECSCGCTDEQHHDDGCNEYVEQSSTKPVSKPKKKPKTSSKSDPEIISTTDPCCSDEELNG